MKILLLGEETRFAPFAVTLAKDAEVILVPQANEADGLNRVAQATSQFSVVCVGENLNDISGINFAHTFAQRFPLINCALMSDLPPKDFHEATEGLGIVMQIPINPDADDAKKLFAILQKISGLM